MNELLLIEMLGEVNPELLENNIIEKDLKRGRLSLLKRIFMRNKWNEEDNFPVEKSCGDLTIEETPFSVDTINSIESDINRMKFDIIEDDYREANEDYKTDDSNSLFNISIFKKSFKNLIKIISGIAVALIVLVGIIIFIVKFIVKKHKFSSFIRRKVQVSY